MSNMNLLGPHATELYWTTGQEVVWANKGDGLLRAVFILEAEVLVRSGYLYDGFLPRILYPRTTSPHPLQLRSSFFVSTATATHLICTCARNRPLRWDSTRNRTTGDL